MSISRRRPAGRLPPFVLVVALLICFLTLDPAFAQEEVPPAGTAGTPGQENPTISFPAGQMEAGLRQAAAEVGEQARSLLEREPLGFDLGTIHRLEDWAIRLPLEVPRLARHVMEQGRLLGFAGSLVMLAFLVAVFYSLFGRKKVLGRLERAAEPLRRYMPEVFYPYFLSLMRIVVASLIPLILFGAYSLIRAFIAYQAPWFLITGTLLMLWSVGALLINLLREALTRELLPIASSHGRTIFRVARIILLYILASFAIFLSAEAFRIPMACRGGGGKGQSRNDPPPGLSPQGQGHPGGCRRRYRLRPGSCGGKGDGAEEYSRAGAVDGWKTGDPE